jgi:hypothetical protein
MILYYVLISAISVFMLAVSITAILYKQGDGEQ